MRVMSVRKVLVLSAFPAVITFGLIGWAYGLWTPGKTIKANPIDFSPLSNPKKIQGSFRISSSPSHNAIPSPGTGGACLIADLNQFGIPEMPSGQNRKCEKNSDCKVGLPERWSGYCDVNGEKTCWVRPGPDNDDLCNKSPSQPWAEDVDHPAGKVPFDLTVPRYPAPSPLESFSAVYPGRIRWRVLACLNGVDRVTDPVSGETRPPCASPSATDQQRRHDFGPIRTVP